MWLLVASWWVYYSSISVSPRRGEIRQRRVIHALADCTMVYDTQSPSYRRVVHHENIGKCNLVSSLSGCNPALYCLAFKYLYLEYTVFTKQKWYYTLTYTGSSWLGHACGRVQSKQAEQAADPKSWSRVVDASIGVQLVQGIDPLFSWCLARR
jgi:hypothetical protein